MQAQNTHPSSVTLFETVAIAFFMVVCTEASRLLGYQSSNVSLFWPCTSIGLVLCLRRGWSSLLGSLGGMGIWAIYTENNAETTAMLTLSIAITTVTGTLILERVARRYEAMSLTKALGAQMMTGILIIAPVAATLGSIMMRDHPLALASRAEFWAGYWMVEAVSVVMFLPALMYNIKPIASRSHLFMGQAYTVSKHKDSTHTDSFRKTEVLSVIAAALAAFFTLILAWQGNTTWTLIMLAIMLPLSLLISLPTSLRGSSLVMMLSAVTVLTVHAKLTGQQLSYETQAETLRVVLIVFESMLVSHFAWSFFKEREQQADKLNRIANENEISGLPNRRAVLKALTDAQATTHQTSLVEIQIRDLFRWSDVAGHEAIGKIEQTIGERIQAVALPQAIVIGHIGAGRFFIGFKDIFSDVAIDALLLSTLEQSKFLVANELITLRWTIGIVDVTQLQSSEPEHLLRASALATQEAVSTGLPRLRRNFSQQHANERREEIEKIESVRRAVADRRIRLLAQPIVATQADSTKLHYEILSRMLDDNGVEQTPAWFLPVISRVRLSIEFDRAVIFKTLEYLAFDRALLAASAKCSINVTGYSLSDASFAEFVLTAIKNSGVPADIIVLEVTETDAIADFGLAQAQLKKLESVGIKCAVDDFGVGLATFDYLKKLRPHWLKIDGSFVRSIGQENADPLDIEIIKAAVRAAKAMGAKTVAEHVETKEQIDVLTALDVDYLQGWALGKPMRIELLLEARQRKTISTAAQLTAVTEVALAQVTTVRAEAVTSQ
jgi:EAL domain-containing protein (putative c-di-GMP-specific phosphodiesterase class I)/GGDEF domain-containing protein